MNLHKSLELYKILEPHLPEDLELEPFDFVSKIVGNITGRKKSTDYRSKYIDAIELISGKSRDELTSLDIMDLFDIFVGGLIDTQIIYLTKFCRDIGLNDA